jgi:LacI family transcriptional regulator
MFPKRWQVANIKDVAEKAGVSSTTVSHVLNSTRFVDPGTKERVVAAIGELGYRPNALARSLRRQETLTIGVVVHDIANPFFAFLVKAIEGVAHRSGYSVILCNSDEDCERQASVVEALLVKRVDGLIVVPVCPDEPILVAAEKQGIPVVYLGRRPVGTKGPMVYEDSAAIAESAVQHLVDDGHRRVAIIAGRLTVPTLTDRMKAYRHVLERQGICFEADLVRTENVGFDDAVASMQTLLRLSNPPTAVFCTNFLMTMGALSVLHQEHVRCPGEVAIVGVDDHAWTGLLQPPLTMVRMETERLGTIAAGLLLDSIRGKTIEECEIMLPAELIVRGSCSERCLARTMSTTTSQGLVSRCAHGVGEGASQLEGVVRHT